MHFVHLSRAKTVPNMLSDVKCLTSIVLRLIGHIGLIRSLRTLMTLMTLMSLNTLP